MTLEESLVLNIEHYIRAQSLEEAYTLCQDKRNVVLGGMLWLKMQSRTVGGAIDLCDLGLDTIEETEKEYRLGAMVTLRQVELHLGLNRLTRGAMARCLSPIVGVQFRNLATLGGSLYGRFGFSDVLTLFMALEAKVELYHGGVVTVEEFAGMPKGLRDILVRVILPKRPMQVAYLAQRNQATDVPVLTCALVHEGETVRCAIGARPNKAVLYRDDEGILSQGITEERARAFVQSIAERATFGDNLRAKAAYRKAICPVLIRRGLLSMAEEG